MSGRLPAELYREIVLYVGGHDVLLSLLTVSRLLNYEAERVLYRCLNVEMDSFETDPLALRGPFSQRSINLKEFAHFNRVGHHVRSITFGGVCGNMQGYLILILLSLPNIKTLALKFVSSSKCSAFRDFLPKKVPFDLLNFTIYNHRGDDGLASFLRSQRSIRSLSWAPQTIKVAHIPLSLSHVPLSLSHIPLSLSDLPHLTSLSSDHPSVIKSILPGRKIRQLNCGIGSLPDFRPGTSFLSVRELALQNIQDAARISTLFPNLQYLVTNYDVALLPQLSLFDRLDRLKLNTNGMRFGTRVDPKVASKLFAGNKQITIVELSPGISGILSRFERGFKKNLEFIKEAHW